MAPVRRRPAAVGSPPHARSRCGVAVAQLRDRQHDHALARVADPRARAARERPRRAGGRARVELVGARAPEAPAVGRDDPGAGERLDARDAPGRRALGRRPVAEQRAEDRIGIGLGHAPVAHGARADGRTRLQPVVVLTTSNEDRDILSSYELGANSYIRKPVDFEQFMEAVRQLGLYWLVLNVAPPRQD